MKIWDGHEKIGEILRSYEIFILLIFNFIKIFFFVVLCNVDDEVGYGLWTQPLPGMTTQEWGQVLDPPLMYLPGEAAWRHGDYPKCITSRFFV